MWRCDLTNVSKRVSLLWRSHMADNGTAMDDSVSNESEYDLPCSQDSLALSEGTVKSLLESIKINR